MFIDRYNDDQVRVAPCCQSASAVEPLQNFNFKSSPHLLKIRQQFDQGLKPVACNRCWDSEKHGHKSRRQSAIEFFNLPIEDNTVVFESLDHSATWACNLACIMCGPHNSSTWATELALSTTALIRLGRRSQKKNKIHDLLNFSEIKKIHFNGGEPLLNSDQFEILNRIDLSKTVISYNTNGTIWPSDQLIELWSRAKLVKLFFSIDAVDQQFEYIRYPADWVQVSNNIIKMKQELPSNVMFSFNSTVGCYNAFEILDVWQWFEKNLSTNREGDVSDFCLQLAHNYDIANLALIAKQDIIEQSSKIPQLAIITNYTRSVIDRPGSLGWQHKLNQIDQGRGTDWKSTLKIGKYY
jgi:MoaA/NifB/PqqE/SkfB family radical SAM enzyme